MKITRLRGGNAQFPQEKEAGDVVVLALGDIFCWDGTLWQLIGGRFLPKALRENFLSYVSTSWPDESSANFDLPTLFDFGVFANYHKDESIELEKIQPWVDKFISRVMAVSKTISSST